METPSKSYERCITAVVLKILNYKAIKAMFTYSAAQNGLEYLVHLK
jgi:hypothetical protein